MDLPLTLMVLLASAGLLTPIFDYAVKGRARLISGYVTLAALLASASVVLYAILSGIEIATSITMLRGDLLGAFFSLAILLVSIFVAAFSLEYMKKDPNFSVYNSLLIFTTLGMVFRQPSPSHPEWRDIPLLV